MQKKTKNEFIQQFHDWRSDVEWPSLLVQHLHILVQISKAGQKIASHSQCQKLRNVHACKQGAADPGFVLSIQDQKALGFHQKYVYFLINLYSKDVQSLTGLERNEGK